MSSLSRISYNARSASRRTLALTFELNIVSIASTFFASVVVAGILASIYYIVCYLARSYFVGGAVKQARFTVFVFIVHILASSILNRSLALFLINARVSPSDISELSRHTVIHTNNTLICSRITYVIGRSLQASNNAWLITALSSEFTCVALANCCAMARVSSISSVTRALLL